MSGQNPDPGPVLSLLNGFRASAVLFSATELGVFEALHAAAGGSLTLEQLCAAVSARRRQQAAAPADGAVDDARDAGASVTDAGTGATATDSSGSVSPDGLDRLCRAAVALGLLQRPVGGPTDAYTLTPAAACYLVAASPLALTGYVRHSQDVVWPLFGGLTTAVATGGNVWQQQFGKPGADVFASVYSTPADMLRFMRGMHSFAALSAPAVVAACDLSGAATLLDLGGATGALCTAACAAYPGLRECVVVELPHVAAAAEAHFAPAPGSPAAGRLRWLAADFLVERERLPQQVDIVILSRILHDWDAATCAQLLRTAHALLAPGGRLLVAEMLLQPDRTGPAAVMLQDLNMLCQTHGRERSALEYAALLEGAGFSGVEARVTGSYLDAVLARKGSPSATASS